MPTTLAELKLVVTEDSSAARQGLVQLQSGITGVTQSAPSMGQALAAGFGLPISPQMALIQGIHGVADAIGDSIGKAAAFDQTLVNVAAVTNATDAQMKQLHDSAIALGQAQDTGAASAQDVASAMFEMSKAGASVDQITGGAAKSVIQLKNAAADAGFTFADSATLAADMVNGFKAQGVSYKQAADLLVGVSNASSTGLQQLKFAYSAVGPVAAGFGVDVKDTATALGLFANASLKGQDAGTSYKSMLLALTPTTKAQKDEFDKLGLTVNGMGNKFFDARGHIQSLASISGTLKTALAGMSDQQQQVALRTIGGTDAIRAFNVLVSAGTPGVQDMANAIHDQGKAAETAAKMQDSLAGHTEQLSSSIETLQISAGEKAAGGIDKLVTALAKLAASKGAQDAISGIGQTVGEAVGAIGKGVDTLSNLGDMFNKLDAIQNVALADMRHNLGITSDAELEAAKQAAVANVTHAASYDTLKTDSLAQVHAMRDGIDGDMQQITSLSQANAQDVHDMTLAQWQALHGDLNATADAITADLGVKGYAAGNVYINSQGQGISDSQALVMNKIDALMQMYDIRDVLGHLGAASAQKFAEALALGLENSLGKLQQGLAGLGTLPGMGELADKIKNLNNTIKVSAGDMVDGTAKAHAQWAASQQKLAAQADAEAAKGKTRLLEYEAQQEKHAAAAGRSAAAHQRALEAHAAAAARHADAVEKAAERKAAAEEKAAERMDAAILKAEHTTIEAMGKLTTDIQSKTATTGDVLVSLIDGLKSATDAKMPAVAAAYQRALDEMTSKTPPALSQIQAEFVKTMGDLAHNPDASIAAWARQQTDALDKLIADQQAADAKILQEQQQKWVEADQKERAGWQQILADQQAAQGQLTGQLGQAAQSMQQALASGKGFDLAGQYKTMMDLANQALAAGNTALADRMRAGAAAIAQAGVGAGQGIYDSLIAALQAAAAQGDVTASLIIQDLQRVQAQAAATAAENASYSQSLAALQMQEAASTATLQQYRDAVAGAQQELTSLKDAETGAKNALDAASASVTAAKAQVQGLQQQYQAAQQALSDFKGAQLEGEGATTEAQFQNQQRQKELQLAILNMQMGGASASNPQLKALQAQLEQTRLAGEQMRLQAEVTFDPLHHALQAIGQDQKELTFDQAKAGALGAQADMAKLNTELAASQRHLSNVEAAQASAQKAYNAASQAVKDQEAEIARLNTVLKEHEDQVKATVDQIHQQEADLKTQHDARLQAISDGQAVALALSTQTAAWQQAASTIPQATTAIGQAAAAIPAAVLPPVQALPAQVGTALAGIAPAAGAALGTLPATVQTALAPMFAVWDRVFGPEPVAGNLLQRLWGHEEGTFWHGIVAYTRQRVQEWFDVVWVASLDEMANKMTAYLHGKAAEISVGGADIGMQIDAGLAQGIRDNVGLAEQAIREAVAATIAAGQQAAESHSPSEASRRAIGAPLGQGVTVGVQDQIPAAGQAMTTLVQQTVQSIPGLTNAVRQQLAGILDLAMKPGATWDSTVAALSTLHLGESLTSRMDNILRGLFGGSLTGPGALSAFLATFGQGNAGLLGPPSAAPGTGAGRGGPLGAAGLPPPASGGGGGPINLTVMVNGLTGDITNPITWDGAVGEAISQMLARRVGVPGGGYSVGVTGG